MDIETLHFTKNGVLYHCSYEHRAERGKVSWFKRPGSEKPCDCSDRETDRQALLGIKKEATHV